MLIVRQYRYVCMYIIWARITGPHPFRLAVFVCSWLLNAVPVGLLVLRNGKSHGK